MPPACSLLPPPLWMSSSAPSVQQVLCYPMFPLCILSTQCSRAPYCFGHHSAPFCSLHSLCPFNSFHCILYSLSVCAIIFFPCMSLPLCFYIVSYRLLPASILILLCLHSGSILHPLYFHSDLPLFCSGSNLLPLYFHSTSTLLLKTVAGLFSRWKIVPRL